MTVRTEITLKLAGAVLLWACIGIFLAHAVGCATAPVNLSPAATQAWKNTRVIKGLDVLRDAAIDANAQPSKLLTDAVTRKIVMFHQSALRLIQATSIGWQAAVDTGLTELLNDVTPSERATLLPYVTMARALIAEVK